MHEMIVLHKHVPERTLHRFYALQVGPAGAFAQEVTVSPDKMAAVVPVSPSDWD
jgi:hypothetical protein